MQLNHYTDCAALLGIVKPDGLCMRATRFSHLNDSQEYRWISDKLTPIKEQLAVKLGLEYDPDGHVYPYVLCFCDLADEALMWRLYGKNGYGFMLTLDYEEIARHAMNPYGTGNNPDCLQGIVYANEKDWEEKFFGAYKIYQGKLSSGKTDDLDEVAAFMKRDIFEYENETRYMRPVHDIISFSCNDEDSIIEKDGEDVENVKFRESSFGVTPYIEIVLPKKALKSITVGFGYNFEQQRDSIKALLDQNGYENVEIVKSKIIL